MSDQINPTSEEQEVTEEVTTPRVDTPSASDQPETDGNPANANTEAVDIEAVDTDVADNVVVDDTDSDSANGSDNTNASDDVVSSVSNENAADATAEAPANANYSVAGSADDGDDSDGDDNIDEDDEDVVEGPAEYVQREKSGRGRRIGGDVRPDDVDYKNIPLLSRFLDRRGRILSRRKTRVSAKVQRRIVQAIKRARHLALLPYTADQTRIVRSKRR